MAVLILCRAVSGRRTVQAQKGMGYPIALQEAHHFAVVKSEERQAFFRLVEGQFVKQGLPSYITNKELRKRVRIF